MHYLPACGGLIEHDSSSIQKSCPVIEMECRDRDITIQLNLHALWLNVHIGRPGFTSPNLIEYQFECLLELNTVRLRVR